VGSLQRVADPHIHIQTRRIVMSEVDVAQIHFLTFHRWIDRGMSEWLAEIGWPFTRILETGPGIPIVDTHLSIAKRVMLDDLITLRTWMGTVGRTSFRSHHEFSRDEEIVATGELVHVCVNRATREPVPVPDWLRERAMPDTAADSS
jgi:YbgC/YbaW family acyl-CoA thioester hydrolase